MEIFQEQAPSKSCYDLHYDDNDDNDHHDDHYDHDHEDHDDHDDQVIKHCLNIIWLKDSIQ